MFRVPEICKHLWLLLTESSALHSVAKTPLNYQMNPFIDFLHLGMLIEGEMLLLGGSWLQFSNIDFLEPNGKDQMRPSIGRGRLCLTNRRLLILSADIDNGTCEFMDCMQD